ncbi:type II toxin-antitoxin system Phd/YefM family antitoxin [Streptomyces sp. NPDC057257]|uniref:type II toxin-antitoxin system Phd/YefM family antitoxin n=1 Tax=Streptomyces sp. NPDC057257 TaxID=3346071 RepID=UPI003641A224
MVEPTRIGLRDLRADLTRRVEAAHFQGEPTVITKNGEPRAVLVPFEWFETVTAAK